jgi:hypothetical protein
VVKYLIILILLIPSLANAVTGDPVIEGVWATEIGVSKISGTSIYLTNGASPGATIYAVGGDLYILPTGAAAFKIGTGSGSAVTTTTSNVGFYVVPTGGATTAQIDTSGVSAISFVISNSGQTPFQAGADSGVTVRGVSGTSISALSIMHPTHPPGQDPSYPNPPSITWDGLENNFGKWRNYINGAENGWILTYNMTANSQQAYPPTYGNRDVDGPAMMVRINVQEATSGENFVGFEWSDYTAAGTVANMNNAGHFYFYDGHPDWYGTGPAAVRQSIWGPADMDAAILFRANATVAPYTMGVRTDGSNTTPNKKFQLFSASTGTQKNFASGITPIITASYTSGNVVIGTTPVTTGVHVLSLETGVTPTTFNYPGFVALTCAGFDEVFAFDVSGNFTQLSSHDPETGEFYTNSFNIYTGKGTKYYPARGRIEEYEVDRVNPEEAYRKDWIRENQELDDIANEYRYERSIDEKEIELHNRIRNEAKRKKQEREEVGFTFDWKRFPKYIRKAWNKD